MCLEEWLFRTRESMRFDIQLLESTSSHGQRVDRGVATRWKLVEFNSIV
jgi:hypothetical protein